MQRQLGEKGLKQARVTSWRHFPNQQLSFCLLNSPCFSSANRNHFFPKIRYFSRGMARVGRGEDVQPEQDGCAPVSVLRGLCAARDASGSLPGRQQFSAFQTICFLRGKTGNSFLTALGSVSQEQASGQHCLWLPLQGNVCYSSFKGKPEHLQATRGPCLRPAWWEGALPGSMLLLSSIFVA